jgi:hypothetical protein
MSTDPAQGNEDVAPPPPASRIFSRQVGRVPTLGQYVRNVLGRVVGLFWPAPRPFSFQSQVAHVPPSLWKRASRRFDRIQASARKDLWMSVLACAFLAFLLPFCHRAAGNPCEHPFDARAWKGVSAPVYTLGMAASGVVYLPLRLFGGLITMTGLWPPLRALGAIFPGRNWAIAHWAVGNPVQFWLLGQFFGFIFMVVLGVDALLEDYIRRLARDHAHGE